MASKMEQLNAQCEALSADMMEDVRAFQMACLLRDEPAKDALRLKLEASVNNQLTLIEEAVRTLMRGES